MSIMGFYTQKEVEEIKKEQKELGYTQGSRQTKVKIIREFDKKVKEIQTSDGDIITRLLSDISDLGREINKKDTKIAVLRKSLYLECDIKIKRLEIIKQKTRKPRIKKKCENRIIDYEIRKLAYE